MGLTEPESNCAQTMRNQLGNSRRAWMSCGSSWRGIPLSSPTAVALLTSTWQKKSGEPEAAGDTCPARTCVLHLFLKSGQERGSGRSVSVAVVVGTVTFTYQSSTASGVLGGFRRYGGSYGIFRAFWLQYSSID